MEDKRVPKPAQGVKPCTTCGSWFIPNRSRFRKCLACARKFKAELVELQRKRNADGVIAFGLRERLHLLHSDDAETRDWLANLIEPSKGNE